MARTGISFDQVAAAADQLTADGDNVTIQAVRERLGTGSPNTIHRHLAEWRAAAPKPERKAKAMPLEIEAAIVDELERQTAAVRAELGKQLEQTKAESGELARVGETLRPRTRHWPTPINSYNPKIHGWRRYHLSEGRD